MWPAGPSYRPRAYFYYIAQPTLAFPLYPPARLYRDHVVSFCGGQNFGIAFVLPLQHHGLLNPIRPDTSSCHLPLPRTLNCLWHPTSVSLDCSCEGQTTPLQLHDQLGRHVEAVSKYAVAETFIGLDKWMAQVQVLKLQQNLSRDMTDLQKEY